jgi:predicted amidohydrolase
MKVAAYQAPLEATMSMDVVHLIREQVSWCEANDVEILCCPEGVLGGLADYAAQPYEIALEVEQLFSILQPLASENVTTIVGFTEVDKDRRLYNSAVVFHQGTILGIYRKIHPAINKSVYTAGGSTPVFTVGGLTFGIVICYDSNFPEPIRVMASKGASALFIPANNGLPPSKGGAALVSLARNADIARARENRISVIRADVAGKAGRMVSYGSSEIVSPDGIALATAQQLVSDLICADID